MKVCTACGLQKELAEFGKDRTHSDGLKSSCKPCRVKAQLAYQQRNKEKVAAYHKEWYEDNKVEHNKKTAMYQKSNRERSRAYCRSWYERNLDHARAYGRSKAKILRSRNPEKYRLISTEASQRRKKRLIIAQPPWAIQFCLDEAYRLARLRSKMFGFKWHVDHIVPLKSKRVCGFHTHTNLQVIPETQNCSKGNRSWPDMAA